MNSHKNIIALAFCLAMICPIKCTSEEENITNTTSHIMTQNLSTSEVKSIKTYEISIEQALELLDVATNNINENTKFIVNDTNFTITHDETRLNDKIEQAITEIAIQVIDSAISTILEEIQSLQTHEISQQDAVAMLQAFAQTLVPGSQFELNDISYTIKNPTKEQTEVIETITTNVENTDSNE